MDKIRDLLPRALQTLAHPTLPAPETTAKCRAYLTGCGWRQTGNETFEEAEALQTAFDETTRWLASWRDGLEPYWLVLTGLSGTGKTLLLKRAARAIADNGERVYRLQNADGKDYLKTWGYAQEGAVFAKWADIVPHSADNQERFIKAEKDWVKAIDDLMPQTGQPVVIDGTPGLEPKRFEVTAAMNLLDRRLKQWTALTTNLTREQLAVFWDVRIASRLMRDGAVLVDLSNVRDYNIRAKTPDRTKRS